MRCATHPDVETNLSCSKCLKPICPRCLIETPVGPRCRQCARLTKVPTFDVARSDFIKAVFAGLGSASGFGGLWLLIRWVTPYTSFFSILLAAAVGYGIGQVISLSVKRKRGPSLKIVAGSCMVIAFVIGNQLTVSGQFVLAFNFYDLIALVVGIYLAVFNL